MNTKQVEAPFNFLGTNISKLIVENNLISMPLDTEPEKVFNVDYDIEYSETDNSKLAIIKLCIYISVSDAHDIKWLNFEFCLDGFFEAPIDTATDEFIALCELNGLTALYGIARGHISALSAAITDTEKITLPMINIKKLVKIKHDSVKS